MNKKSYYYNVDNQAESLAVALQAHCSCLVGDDSFARTQLVLWTPGSQSGHYSVSIYFRGTQCTSSKYHFDIRDFRISTSCPPKFCINIVFNLSWDSRPKRNLKQCLCKILGDKQSVLLAMWK